MPGKTIGIQFNYGFAGQLGRNGDEVSRSRIVEVAGENIYFGDPVMINTDGTCKKFNATGVAATFAGVAIRRVKSSSIYPQQNNAFYAAQEVADICERGCLPVVVNVGSPAVGGIVYVRTVLNGAIPAGVVGGFEATADGANSIALTNAKWGTTKDANGVAELVILGRQGV